MLQHAENKTLLQDKKQIRNKAGNRKNWQGAELSRDFL
jgi:hypothetical protein